MPRFAKEVESTRISTGPLAGSSVRWEYTFKSQTKAFHEAIRKRSQEMLRQFAQSYSRRVPKRTGRLSRGFLGAPWVEKDYGKRDNPSVTNTGINTTVEYAFIVEAGGRGKKYAGTRRAGHMKRVFATERRKLTRDVKNKILPDIYGA